MLGGPSRDGGVIGRWVEDVDSGKLRVETWRGSDRGWVEGGMDAGTVMGSPELSPKGLRAAGIPAD